MLLSIVMVTLNCGDLAKMTLSSIYAQQTDLLYEVIVVDGLSSDNTLSNVREFPVDTIISESDSGIYDAMNKGISLANGDFVFFLNAGDVFFSNTVLQNIKIKLTDNAKRVLIGTYAINSPRCLITKKLSPIWLMNFYMPYSHQSVFVPTQVARECIFDIKFKFAADYKQLFLLYKKSRLFIFVDDAISIVMPGGVSDINRLKVYNEWYCINKSFPSYVFFMLLNCLSRVSRLIKSFIS